MLLTPAQIKPKSFRSRRHFYFFFLLFFSLRADAPHIFYVRSWTLCCFHTLIGTQAFRRALTASVHGQPRGDKDRQTAVNRPLQWRNQFWQSLEEGAGKRCSECCLSHGAVCSIMRSRRVLSSGVSLACGLGDLIPSRPSLVACH